MIIPDGLQFVRDVSWGSVFAQWRNAESWQESWRTHWEERGFDSWASWRSDYAAPLKPEMLEWKLCHIKNLKCVSGFYGVPTHGWSKKCYEGDISRQIESIQDSDIVSGNLKIRSITEDFPIITMLTGIVKDDKIYIIEGMHRANAIMRLESEQKEIESQVYIALAKMDDEVQLLGTSLTT